jgi:hypothetical protein
VTGSLCRRVTACLTIALAVPLAGTGAESADAALSLHIRAAQAPTCATETKRLNAFKRTMPARKRAFFRSHRSSKQRRAFLAKQKKKLTALKRARARCLRPAPAPPQQPQPQPQPPDPTPPDTTPPELRIDSPGGDAWFGQATATVHGIARDGGAGIAAVACNGQAAARAGDGFTCEVPLGKGSNTIGVTASDAAGNSSAATVTVNHAPGGVSGDSGATALGAVKNVDADPRHEDATISTTPEGARIARKEIAVRVAGSATVEQVNEALASVDGTIVGAIDGWQDLAVGIPDPGSLAALDALLAGLRGRPGVERAARAEIAETQEIPAGFASPLPSADALRLSHLFAMRMPAAWNARRAIDLADRPTLIVADHFGNGPLSTKVDATYNSGDLRTRTTSSPHGYHVVGIAASGFANDGTDAGTVTGVFPATTRLHVLDVIGASYQMVGVRIVQTAQGLNGNVVVNTSLGPVSPTPDLQSQSEGSDWAQLVRNSPGLEDRMLHATSAGNSANSAGRNTRWSSAAVRSDLQNSFGFPMTALRNTLAVENLSDTGAPAFEPGCLSPLSNRNGTIAAVGEDVFSHLFGAQAGNNSGTSMASPEVAGLATFLWSIEPTLTAPQMRDLMVATARPALPNDSGGCGTDVPSSPRLDAYTAALGLDQAAAPTKQTAQVRYAIVNFDGDDTFDEDDLESFSNVSRPTAGDRDWSRQDLNGDGFTGGTEKAPLDLDPSGTPVRGAPKLEKIHQEIEGVSVEFDEASVTDMQALCYWAYSGLYEGSEDERADLLDPADNCGAKAQFTNGKLVAVGRSPRGLGQQFPPHQLWTIEPPAAPVAFTPGVADQIVADPAWSPDGQKIAYSKQGFNVAPHPEPGIWIIGAAGGTSTRLTDSEGDLDATWSPDGKRIAFAGRSRDPHGIYVVDAAGGTPTLIPGTEGLMQPSWSPDGRRIAAASEGISAGTAYDLFTFSPDGQNMRNLTNTRFIEEGAPDWSPGGGRIIFTSDQSIPSDTVRRHRLWIIDADGSNLTQLTFPFGSNTGGTTVEDADPAWSPDGLSVTFARSHQNSSRFVMTRVIAENAAVPVTPLPTNNTDHTFNMPDWQPIPVP